MLLFVGGIDVFQNNRSLPDDYARRNADVWMNLRAVAKLRPRADDRAPPHLHAATEDGVLADDAALQHAALTRPHAGKQYAALRAAVRAKHDVFPAHRLAARKVQIAVAEGRRAADVAPVALGGVGADGNAVAQQAREQVFGKIVKAAGGHRRQNAPAEKINAAVDAVGKGLAPRGLFHKRRHAAVAAEHHAVFGRVGGGRENDGRLRARIEVRAQRAVEREIEHRVAREHDDGFPQPVERLPDRAGRAQRRRLAEIADVQPRRTQRFDLLGAVHRRHRHAGDAAVPQRVKNTRKRAFAGNRHERLGHRLGDGKQPRSQSAGQNGGGQPGLHHHIHLHSAALRRRKTLCHTARPQKPAKRRIQV